VSIDGNLHFNAGYREGPTFAFIDADNMKFQFERALVRRGVHRDQLACFDLNKVFWLANAQRYYVFSAVPDGSEPPGWLKAIRSTDSCIFRSGRLTIKGNIRKQQGVDVMLAVEALRCAFQGSLETCILFGCDGDMLPLIEMVVSTGKRIVVVGFNDPEKGSVTPQLRDAADSYIHVGSTLLKQCMKDEHRFFGMDALFSHHFNHSGELDTASVSGEAIIVSESEDGSVHLCKESALRTIPIQAARFGSMLGAKAWIRLNGSPNW
jgi:uncharacterized LabA/DUF88 family protein